MSFYVHGHRSVRCDYSDVGGDVEWEYVDFEESFDSADAAFARFMELHNQDNVVGLVMGD